MGSAGSCFAQHVARALRQRGFRYLDVEPPPAGLPERFWPDYGYGLFSARFGNIYTARQLRQLLEEAFGERTPATRVWERNGRYFDPFRPSIEATGLSSPEEVLALREENHLPAVRRLVADVDVFVFTLGLTEAWASMDDGSVYPSCPGVIAGEFDGRLHRFHNFSFSEVYADMVAVIERMRNVNEKVRFLFTVSPVPLIATATGHNVLVATAYSKAVLRAVAGELYSRYEFVDYYPSYDIIAASASRGFFLAPDARGVPTSVVEIVMKHFFGEHVLPIESVAIREVRRQGGVEREARAHDDALTSVGVICDEEKLDPISR